jgi:hypothetical protein
MKESNVCSPSSGKRNYEKDVTIHQNIKEERKKKGNYARKDTIVFLVVMITLNLYLHRGYSSIDLWEIETLW